MWEIVSVYCRCDGTRLGCIIIKSAAPSRPELGAGWAGGQLQPAGREEEDKPGQVRVEQASQQL